MRALWDVVLVAFVSFGCGDSDSPAAPSTTMADAPSYYAPLTPVPLTPAPTGGGIAQLAPPPDGFNAHNARIEYVDGAVTITFVPVDMPRCDPMLDVLDPALEQLRDSLEASGLNDTEQEQSNV